MQLTVDEYILSHIDQEPAHLQKLNRDTHVMCLYANMCSGHLQGRLLKMLTRMIKPKRVLELGTFTATRHSASPKGCRGGAELHTVEINDELEDFIRQRFDESPQAGQIHLHIGDAER